MKLKTIQITENTKNEHHQIMCQLFQSIIKERDKKNLNKKQGFPIVTSKSNMWVLSLWNVIDWNEIDEKSNVITSEILVEMCH